MKTGYQIYVKGMNKNGTRSRKFKNAGLHNRPVATVGGVAPMMTR